MRQSPIPAPAWWAAALGLALLAPNIQAQVLRCTDPATGQVSYTNGQCASGQRRQEVQPAQSADDIASERRQAQQARERWDADQARDQERQMEQARQAAAAARAQANRPPAARSESAACRQAQQALQEVVRHGSSLDSDHAWRVEAAQKQVALQCLEPDTYRALEQSRAEEPRYGMGYTPPYGYPPPHVVRPKPLPQPLPAERARCNVFRCYDKQGNAVPLP